MLMKIQEIKLSPRKLTALYGPDDEMFFIVPFADFPAILRDRKTFSPLLKGSHAGV